MLPSGSIQLAPACHMHSLSLKDAPFAPKARTLAALGLTLFAAFMVASTVSFVVFRNAIRESILRNELPLSSDNIYSEIQRDLFEPILISSLMANDTFVKDWILKGEPDEERIVRYLRRIQQEYGTITAFLVSNTTERYYHPTAPTRPLDPEHPVDKWFYRVRELDEPYEINIDPDMANRLAMTIFINYRILDDDGRFLAATGVGLSVSSVKSLMNAYHERFERDVYFYNRRGELILHRLDEDQDARNLEAHQHLGEALAPILEQIDQGRTNINLPSVRPNGALAHYRYIPELDWILVIEQASDGTRPALLRSFAVNMLICLLTAVILLVFIRRTSLRYQVHLETRNRQLSLHKERIEQQAAALDRKSEELSRMVQILCHDLANPIAAVKGLMDLGEEGEELILELRSEIATSIDQAHDMIDLVRKLRSMEEGKLSLALQDVALAEAVANAARSARRWLEAKDVQLVTDLPAGLIVRAEPTSLTGSVLANLLTNAIKFSPRGSRVHVTAHPEPRSGMVRIEVTDHGIGMPQSLLDSVFESGRNTSRKGTEGESGTGFGLPLVKRFVEAYGGTITIESRDISSHPANPGTRVTLRIPGRID